MRKLLLVCALLSLAALRGTARGQGSAPPSLSSRLTPDASPSATPKVVKSPAEKSASGVSPVPVEEIVTEIYADKAVFDSTKSIGVFTGHIVVIDPRFQLQGAKLTH